MGTITARTRSDGTTGYKAQLRLKRAGKVVHQETQTFDRRSAATAWLKKRETALAEPGALERLRRPDPPLGDVIGRYVDELGEKIGRTKAQVLRAIREHDIADIQCSRITSADIAAFAKELGTTPATTGNYVSHLSAVFAVARPAWGYPLDYQAAADASVVLRRLGLIAKSTQRDRRPTREEMDRIMAHFDDRSARRPSAVPMMHVCAFAMFSTRRLAEITRIRWPDMEGDRILVRDMKHPGQKVGNNVWCDLPEPVPQLLALMPHTDDRIFPYHEDTITAAFTDACHVLGIEDLTFHDLRHEGVSRLFEMGRTIPQAAGVSGHRSWTSLKRYTHLRHTGDRWADWPWLARLAPVPAIVPAWRGRGRRRAPHPGP